MLPLVSHFPGRLLSRLADATECVRAVVTVHHFNVTPVTRLHLRLPFLLRQNHLIFSHILEIGEQKCVPRKTIILAKFSLSPFLYLAN